MWIRGDKNKGFIVGFTVKHQCRNVSDGVKDSTWGKQLWSSRMRRIPWGLAVMRSRHALLSEKGSSLQTICSRMYSSYRKIYHSGLQLLRHWTVKVFVKKNLQTKNFHLLFILMCSPISCFALITSFLLLPCKVLPVILHVSKYELSCVSVV